MHRLTQLKETWKTTVVQTTAGHFTSNPQNVLDAESRTLATFWRASTSPARVEVLDRDHLPQATAAEIRAASNSFSRMTSQSLDGLHPRQLPLVSDSALDTLGALFQAVEPLGLFPKQLFWTLFPLLEKPKGGV
eukprot:8838230-Pyramimonas_sp.AAC.1